jgi:hypothetical protein
MADDYIATGLQPDDPDPEGTDVYGMLPLIAEVPDDEREDEDDYDDAEREDRPSGRAPIYPQAYTQPSPVTSSGADDDNSDEEPPLISPSSIEITVPKGTELTDDPDAYEALIDNRGGLGVSPGEAAAIVTYSRPLSEEEKEMVAEPMFDGIRWVDDPSHTSDVLKAGKTERGVDTYLDDASYGDHHMRSPEEQAERQDSDRFAGWNWRAQPKASKPLPSTFVPARDAAKAKLLNAVSKKLVVEHANWLADQDKASGNPIRPRGYYEDVARLWTRKSLFDATAPTSSAGNWSGSNKTFVGIASKILSGTRSKRSRFSSALPNEVDLGDDSGWGLSSITHAIKNVAKGVEHGVEKGASAAYKYSGAKYVVSKAEALALAPIKAIVRRFTNKIVSRRANYLAKQQGLSKPTPAINAAAKAWSKSFVRKNNSKFGGAIASLMGAAWNPREYGVRNVDINMGKDEIGFGTGSTIALIALGPIGLVMVLGQLLTKSSSAGAPQTDPNADPNAVDPNADPNAPDASSPGGGGGGGGGGDGGDGADPGAGDGSDDGSADSSGATRFPKTVTIEQINRMKPARRNQIQIMIRRGHIRLK